MPLCVVFILSCVAIVVALMLCFLGLPLLYVMCFFSFIYWNFFLYFFFFILFIYYYFFATVVKKIYDYYNKKNPGNGEKNVKTTDSIEI